MARTVYGHIKIPIQKLDLGFLRPVVGANVTIYRDRDDGTPSIDSDGNVLANANIADIYDGPYSNSLLLSQPLVTDSLGYVNGYAANAEYHYRIQLLDGTFFGLIGIPQFSPKADGD
jgi:hypothetical protein